MEASLLRIRPGCARLQRGSREGGESGNGRYKVLGGRLGVKPRCANRATRCPGLKRYLILFGIILGTGTLGLAPKSWAQTPEHARGAAPGAAASTASERNAKQATSQFRLDPETYDKAVAYSRAGYQLYFVSVAWGIVLLLVLLQWHVVKRLR